MAVPSDGPLSLRPWSEDDAPAVHRACQDPEIQRWNPAVSRPYRLEHALAFVRSEAIPDELAFAFTVDGAVAGCIDMKPVPDRIGHVGYWYRAMLHEFAEKLRALDRRIAHAKDLAAAAHM